MVSDYYSGIGNLRYRQHHTILSAWAPAAGHEFRIVEASDS